MDDVLNCCHLCKTCTAKNETKPLHLALSALFQVKSVLVVSSVSQVRTVPLERWRSMYPGLGVSLEP